MVFLTDSDSIVNGLGSELTTPGIRIHKFKHYTAEELNGS